MHPVDAKFFARKRYMVAALVFLGWILMIILRANLSIAIVDMTSNRSVTVGNQTYSKPAQFAWTSIQKGLILSAFSWGYFLSPLGAIAANKFGGATVFGAGIAITSTVTVCTPIVVHWNFAVFVVARFFEGIFEGFSAASIAEVFVHWAPPSERSRLIVGSTSGAVIGTMLSYPICGFIAHNLSWMAVFYITGMASFLWYFIWIMFVKNTPAEDTFISFVEKEYLSRVNAHISTEEVVYPWRKILTSPAVLAYMNERFVESWSISFLMYCLPMYVKDVLDVNIQEIGFISGIPHFCAVIGLIGGACVADYLRNRRIMSITNVHRLFLTSAQTTAVFFLIIVALWREFVTSMIFLSLFRLFFTINEVSYRVLPVDLGARYASFILGLGTMCLSCGYTLNPIIMGLIVKNHTPTEWTIYFLFLSTFNLWGGFIFYNYGSGELQPWAA